MEINLLVASSDKYEVEANQVGSDEREQRNAMK
jgi:hypothetical protein